MCSDNYIFGNKYSNQAFFLYHFREFQKSHVFPLKGLCLTLAEKKPIAPLTMTDIFDISRTLTIYYKPTVFFVNFKCYSSLFNIVYPCAMSGMEK